MNTSPEPVSNWVLSLAEDLFVIGLGILTLSYPVAAFGVAGVLIVLIFCLLGVLSRAAWRRWAPNRPQPV